MVTLSLVRIPLMKKEDLATILAAEIGSRVHPLKEMKPKCLVHVNNMPIIDHQIESLDEGWCKRHG